MIIDNSRTGLDTSKNQCSAPAVTALKNYWRYHVYNLFRLKNSSNVFAFIIIIIGCLTGNLILFWNKKKTRGWVNCQSGFSPTKKEKELMTKGITPSSKKRVFAFSKEEVRSRLWLSAILRDADSFNPEHSGVCEFQFKAEDFEANYAPRTSTARVRMRLKPIAVHSVFLKYLFKHFLGRKGLTDL